MNDINSAFKVSTTIAIREKIKAIENAETSVDLFLAIRELNLFTGKCIDTLATQSLID